MVNRKFFFETVRNRLFGGKLSPKQVTGMTAILDYWETNYAAYDLRWLAYALGTVHLETNRSFEAVEEGYYLGAAAAARHQRSLRYYPYYGRGLVQLTWKSGYQIMGEIFGVNLVAHPEKALDLDLSIKIMFHGMINGNFTKKKFSDYFNGKKEDWRNARRIINWLDKAEIIADFAKKYYSAISII